MEKIKLHLCVQVTHKARTNTQNYFPRLFHIMFIQLFSDRAEKETFFYSMNPNGTKKKKFYFQLSSAQSLFLYLKFPGQRGRGGVLVTTPTPCTASGPKPGHLPLPNIDQTVTCCRDEPCEIPIKRVCSRK